MLKTFYKSLFVVFSLVLGLCLTNCTSKPADEIAGTYSGTLTKSVEGLSIGEVVAEVNINKISDDKVTVIIPALSNGDEMALPALTIADVVVSTKKTGGYKLAKTPINITTEDFIITGSIEGTVIDKKLTLTGAIKPGAMPMNIDINFVSK